MSKVHETLNEKITLTVTREVSFTKERISDVLCSAFEGESSYWAVELDFVYGPGVTAEDFRKGGKFEGRTPRYLHLPFMDGCGVKIALIDEVEEEKPLYSGNHFLNMEAIEKGLRVLNEKYPHHMKDLMEENDDGITSDSLLQCCLFGEVVYG